MVKLSDKGIQRRLLTFIEIFLIISITPFLFISRTLAGEAVYLSLSLIILAILCMFYVEYKSIEIVLEKKEIIATIVLSILFIIMLSIFDILGSQMFKISSLLDVYPKAVAYELWIWSRIIYLPSIFVSAIICVWICVHYALLTKKESHINGVSEQKCYIFCLAMIAVVSVVYLSSAYPGLWIQDDVKGVWSQVSERKWNDWHTLGYELFVGICSFFAKSTFSVNVVQTILWVLLNSYILKVLQEDSNRTMKIYTFVLIISTTSFEYLDVMYKDVVFSMGMLAVTAGIYHVGRSKKIRIKDIVVILMGGMFAGLCRHAGNVAVTLALISALVFFIIKKQKEIYKRWIGIVIFQIVIFIFVNMVLMSALNVTENPKYVKYGMPMVAIGAAAHQGIEFDDEDKKELEKVMTVKEWGECYDKYWADTISRRWGRIGGHIDTLSNLIDNEAYGTKLLKINMKLLVHHPYRYIKSIFDMNNIIWKMGTPNDGYVWSMCNVKENEDITYLASYTYTKPLSNFKDKMPITRALFLRGGVALFFILFSGVVHILKNKRYFLVSLIPILIYDCMLIITIPAQDSRYILPGIECAIFFIAVTFGIEKMQNDKADCMEG
ncbi:MAG: hypothetical protein K2M78_08460 [Lachnospiraceae bacterium]|nr:hypothetical protein [Lachnospiraceae bacterium]